MSTVTKDVLYIDVDDEITSLIDRLTASDHKVVALVLPKRATVLQSIVNMKLLKRAADEHNKHVVLVTTEAGLLPLAGAVGLHVAHTPNSKPVIPKKPDGMADEPVNVDEPELTEEDFDSQANAAASIGALAAASDNEETIQLDNEPEVPTGAESKPHKPKTPKAKKGKDKKLKVPNFNAFRKKSLLIGGGLVLLLLIFIFGFIILPKATIAIKTDSQDVNKRLDVTFDTSADSVDADSGTVPAEVEQTQKVATQSVQASGQENKGNTATGSVRMSTQVCAPNLGNDPSDVPQGTGISTGGKTYITQESASFTYSGGHGSCIVYSSQKVNITAQAPGAQYNTQKSADFSVNGRSEVSAAGSADGGTDNIIRTVTAGDIESVKQKLSSQVDNSVKDELAGKLEDRGLYVIKDSFNTGTPEVTVSAKAGDQVESVNATQKTTYSLVGVKKQDIEDLITKKVDEDIDTKKQRVLNTGLDQAVFKLQNQQNNSAIVQMSMDVTALAGPKLDDDQIKEQIAGKKSGEVRDTLKNYPGVTDVNVKLSPFWVTSVPKSASKITITYEK